MHDLHSKGMNVDVRQDGGLLEVRGDRMVTTTLRFTNSELQFAADENVWALSVNAF